MPTATADHAASAALGDAGPDVLPAPDVRWPVALRQRAARRIPAASTIEFRVAFGLLVAYSSIRFVLRGWIDEFYLAPAHHLTYPGFDWIRPLPAPWMHVHVLTLAALGVLIAAGIHARIAAGVFVVGFAYVELIDRALYLNHYWFVTLAAVLLAVLPGPARHTHNASRTVPAITVWALRAQLGVVYTFAGIAKLNADWLFLGEPLGIWLAARTDRPIIGPLLDEPVVALIFSWAGAAFDLTIVAGLLWRRSRPLAYAVLVVFHIVTAMLFQIGVFAWVMIALTPIFFEPDWPTRLRRRRHRRPVVSHAHSSAGEPVDLKPLLVAFLAVFAAMNIALPLRHWFAEGNVRWNDDGYELAWRVMLTDRAGYLEFDVTDPASGDRWRVPPELVLTEWQSAEAETRPALALQTAHFIADHFAALGYPDVEVHADSFVAMNGRLRQRMLDPTVDLTTVSRWAPASDYVLPLDPPVRE